MSVIAKNNPTVDDLLVAIEDIAMAVEESGDITAYNNLLAMLEDHGLELD